MYENQSMKLSKDFDMLNKRADNLTLSWRRHDNGLCHERVKKAGK